MSGPAIYSATEYVGEALKFIAVPAAYYELVSEDRQENLTAALHRWGSASRARRLVLASTIFYFLVILYPYISALIFLLVMLFYRPITGVFNQYMTTSAAPVLTWTLVSLILYLLYWLSVISAVQLDYALVFSGLAVSLAFIFFEIRGEQHYDLEGFIFPRMVTFILIGIPFLVGRWIPVTAMSYLMAPYNFLRSGFDGTFIGRLFPTFSVESFFSDYRTYLGKVGRLVPEWIRFEFLAVFIDSANIGYSQFFALVFNGIAAGLVIGLVLVPISTGLLLVLKFGGWCESLFPSAKRKGVVPLGAFIIYLAGTTVVFFAKTMSYFNPFSFISD